MEWCYRCNDEGFVCGYCGMDDYLSRPHYGSKNRDVPKGVHVMNSDEAKVMRQLKAKTGLTEEKIREVKKYRVMLSEAQKNGQKALRSKRQKLKDNLMKSATEETKLAKEHPKTKEVYAKLVNEYNNSPFNWGVSNNLSINYKND